MAACSTKVVVSAECCQAKNCNSCELQLHYIYLLFYVKHDVFSP